MIIVILTSSTIPYSKNEITTKKSYSFTNNNAQKKTTFFQSGLYKSTFVKLFLWCYCGVVVVLIVHNPL